MSETMSVQWFPGHMAKTRRLMAANLKMVDIVVEITDARIPQWWSFVTHVSRKAAGTRK